MKDIDKANLILENIFIFDEDGDMEKAQVKVKNEPLDWAFCPNGDFERIYMLNRFTYLDLLTRVYRKTCDRKYIDKAIELIESWINNVVLIPSPMTRTLDTAMRIYHTIKFLLDNKIEDNSFKNRVDRNIKAQIDFLKKEHIEKHDLSNWGLIQAISIAIAGLYFKDKNLYEESLNKISLMMQIQYIDDSSIHWEKAIGYHNFLLLWLLRLCEFQKKYKQEIKHKDQIKKIAETSLITSDLSGRQINNGDSDLTKIEFLLRMYSDIFKEKLEEKNYKLFKNYGLYVEKKEKSMLSAYNQSMSSNHTHADFTHFNYQNDKIKILDGGRYTYKESWNREYFKLFAHNNIIIDKISPMGYVSSWQTDYYPTINPIFINRKRNSFVEMSYFDDRRNIFVKRRLLYLENGDLIVFDQVRAKGDHIATMNLMAKGIDKNNFMINKNFYLKTDAKYSPQYNSLETCQSLVVSEKFKDSYSQCMIFGDVGKYEFTKVSRDNRDLSTKEAIGVKSKEAIYVNIFEEISESPRVLKAQGIKFYARAACLYSQNDLEIYR